MRVHLGAHTAPSGWEAIRAALAGWRPSSSGDGVDAASAAVEVTVDHGGLRLRVGETVVPVDPGLAPDELAAALEGLR